MSKSVVLVLISDNESEYGEHANIPVFNAHGGIVGWTGGEVPESGHPCEFNELNDEGFTVCASSMTVNRLRSENAKLRELVRDLRFCARQSICLKCEHGRICDLRLDERCKELGIEGE